MKIQSKMLRMVILRDVIEKIILTLIKMVRKALFRIAVIGVVSRVL